ncbi:MAG: HAD-IA family hydrolase [Rhodobacteraceae bacterium]|nr:HAD-IA family hydrolase [Paracoccaceae bacterium]
MSELRLVVFDVDGTLVDSQRTIVDSMRRAFEAVAVDMPTREAVLGIVGLSIDVAMARLVPDAPRETHHALADAYKSAYFDLRTSEGTKATSPFYPGARETLMALAARDDLLLGVATGKSKRGLDKLIEGHGLEGVFVTEQVADFHPSKPHPAMLRAALAETGTEPQNAVMIGDTSYDMDMARAAGMRAIGVGWGYHAPSALAAADRIIDGFKDLPGALDDIWR